MISLERFLVGFVSVNRLRLFYARRYNVEQQQVRIGEIIEAAT